MTTASTDSPAQPANTTPDDPTTHTTAFFDSLYADVPEDLHALLWTLQDKKSTWVSLRHGPTGDPTSVGTRARALADLGKDVYVAVSVAATAGLHDTRIKSANAAGIMGLWADIDIADPDVHKKFNLPPTIDAALELLDDAGVPPTLIVHSGHGLQAWWLFKEFWAFDTEEDRLAAAGLAQRWNQTLQSRAAVKSWVVDSTFDLARVMRVPGTLNRKGQPVMPVRLLVADGPRYTPDDIEPFCVDESFLASRGVTSTKAYVPDADLDVSSARKVDYELLQAACDNDPRFKATWDMARKDFTDQSPSSYDLSLATLAAALAWSDQQISNLLYSFRQRHRLDTSKALRTDYVIRTLRKAREGLAREESSEALDDVADALATAKASGDDEQVRDARRDALDVIGQQLGLEVLHFIKYLSEPPQFAMIVPTGTIPLGGADGMLVWMKFRQSVWETTGHQIERFKAVEWDRITRLVPAAWEEQDVGAEATDRGEVASWLSAYLGQRPPVDDLAEAATSEYPYKETRDGAEERVVMFGPAFKRWLYLTYQEKVGAKEMGRRLRSFGCEPFAVNVVVDNKRSSRSVWRLPAGWSA